MTQKEKTLAAREAFYKVLNSMPLDEWQYLSIGLAVTNWVTESYAEGINEVLTSRPYTPVMTDIMGLTYACGGEVCKHSGGIRGACQSRC